MVNNQEQRIAYRGHQQGSVLLVALIILGVIAISAIALSLLLLHEIRSSRYSDNGMVSYYVAESGIERSLWRLSYAKDNSLPNAFVSIDQLTKQCGAEDASLDGKCIGNGRCYGTTNPCTSDPVCAPGFCVLGDRERLYDFTSAAIKATTTIAYSVLQNSPVFMDIFDPLQEGSPIVTGISQINVNWYLSSCSGVDGSAKLEITYTPIEGVTGTLTPGVQTTQVAVCGCATATGSGEYACTPVPVSISQTKFYRITYRSLDVPVKRIELTASDSLGAAVAIPSPVTVVVTGSYRESQSRVTANAQWKDALSGAFSYVVFSEESLIKDTKSPTGNVYPSSCGYCSSAGTACSVDADCASPDTCGTINPLNFCFDVNPPTETYGGAIQQTDAGSCNSFCNGLTYCGDGTIQSPNGAASLGALPASDGHEECDSGFGNSDTTALTCRKSCVNPTCGDKVTDNGSYNNNGVITTYSEECDDGDATPTDACDTTGINPLSHGQCTLTYCGDGQVQTPNGKGTLGIDGLGNEACDDPGGNGGAIGQCKTDCSGVNTP